MGKIGAQDFDWKITGDNLFTEAYETRIILEPVCLESLKYLTSYLSIFLKTVFKSILDQVRFLTAENSEVPFTSNLEFDKKLLEKFLMCIRNDKGPRIQPQENQTSTLVNAEYWRFRTFTAIIK